MTSLEQILHEHGSGLVIDCASSAVHCGALTPGSAHWVTRQEEAGTGLFAALDELQKATQRGPLDFGAFVFNEGPGSILGIRTAAVALRTWIALQPRPVFRYQGLSAWALAQAKAEPSTSFTAIADARRETWHAVAAAGGRVEPLRRLPADALAGPCRMPEGFRAWTSPPAHCIQIPYTPSAFLASLADQPLLEPAPEPDAFMHEDPQYQTWSAKVHRAPS